MDCTICEYRRLAREAINAQADILMHWALEQRDLLESDALRLSEMLEQFRKTYRAEQAAAA